MANPNEPEIKRLIQALPATALPGVLAEVVRQCIQKKVFGERKPSDVVASLERIAAGAKKPESTDG